MKKNLKIFLKKSEESNKTIAVDLNRPFNDETTLLSRNDELQ